MRYLNKIIFINSATSKFAEINLNGNIHFIGTQGVGKSTILRAILFFYNANSRKLGVPTGPTNKSYAEWYLPFANSFIVYEVQKETGPFSIVTFKLQNRVCFRFIDCAFDKKYFIDSKNIAFDTMEKPLAMLDAQRIQYTRIIKLYDEYRDILYGNNEGKKHFRKYALLESRQYNNIPRTIQNVFLNSKLDADFIKQTIIMSMNEEDITVDLQNYTHHLTDFDLQLTDIKKLRHPSVQKHAETAAKLFVAINHLEKDINKGAQQLAWAVQTISKNEPFLVDRLHSEQGKFLAIKEKIAKAKSLFQQWEKKVLAEISVLTGKLKELRTKKNEYEKIAISKILRRVAARNDLEINKQNLKKEEQLLSSQYAVIHQKYDALLGELKNQLDTFLNNKEREKLKEKETFYGKRDCLIKVYETVITEIRTNHRSTIETMQQEFEEKQNNVFHLKNKKTEIECKRFFEKEIDLYTKEILFLSTEIVKGNHSITYQKEHLETVQKKWEFEEKSEKDHCEIKKEKIEKTYEKFRLEQVAIKKKIEHSNESLYGWLSKNHPGWQNTIGKICKEDVLFQSDLSPKLTPEKTNTLYGISINLNEIERKVKTIAEYEHDTIRLNEILLKLQEENTQLTEKLENNLNKIKKRNQTLIKQYKESIREIEYTCEQSLLKKQRDEVALNDLIERAKIHKDQKINEIEMNIEKAIALEIAIKEKIKKIENKKEQHIKLKLKERNDKIQVLQKQRQQHREFIDLAMTKEIHTFNTRKEGLYLQKKQELDYKGADIKRLSEISEQVSIVDAELDFIENNRDIAAEYNKDKRELFDREHEFKNKKQLLEKKLDHKTQKHRNTIHFVETECDSINQNIQIIEKDLHSFKEDMDEFERFKLSEVYQSIEPVMSPCIESYKNDQRCRDIIATITRYFYSRMQRINELKETIDNFLGNFSSQNVFNFKTNLVSTAEYMEFSEQLTNFIEEDKISEFEKRIHERFASIITLIGKETTHLISKTGDIQKIVKKINRDFIEKNFVGAIKRIELKVDESAHAVVVVLKMIKDFNDRYSIDLGETNLFSTPDRDKNNKKAIDLLGQLVKEIATSKRDFISLSDSFELKFKVEENQNDTGWVEKLSNVGSDGTDVLVKAMVNIMLLNVFKEGASKQFKDFRLHCMMDEIGKLHPTNVKGILKFANDRNILLINGSPIEHTPLQYKHIYQIEKDHQNVTKVKRILSNLA